MKSNAKKFDQFYTRKDIAEDCFRKAVERYGADAFFVEPSAGTGAFLMDGYDFYACDIEPKDSRIHRKDFLKDDISEELPKDRTIVTVGNPPFGHKSAIAVQFLNKALSFSKAVCFILPIQFRKYITQKTVNETAMLVLDETLEAEAFIHKGKPYSVRCCFQIWENDSCQKDLRMRTPPRTSHPDLLLYQYNQTPETEKYFDKERFRWDFAILRQGYGDYSRKETDPDALKRNRQWIFLGARNEEALEILRNIDFKKLSEKNTTIPGFGKADVVAEYERIKKPVEISDFF